MSASSVASSPRNLSLASRSRTHSRRLTCCSSRPLLPLRPDASDREVEQIEITIRTRPVSTSRRTNLRTPARLAMLKAAPVSMEKLTFSPIENLGAVPVVAADKDNPGSSRKKPTASAPSSPRHHPEPKRGELTCTAAATPVQRSSFLSSRRESLQPKCRASPVLPSVGAAALAVSRSEFLVRLKKDPALAKFFNRSSLKPALFPTTVCTGPTRTILGSAKLAPTTQGPCARACELYESRAFAEAVQLLEPAYVRNKTHLPLACNYALSVYMQNAPADFLDPAAVVSPFDLTTATQIDSKLSAVLAHKQLEVSRTLSQLSLIYPKNGQLLYNKAVVECHLRRYDDCLATVKSAEKSAHEAGRPIFGEVELTRAKAISLAGIGDFQHAMRIFEGHSRTRRIVLAQPATPFSCRFSHTESPSASPSVLTTGGASPSFSRLAGMYHGKCVRKPTSFNKLSGGSESPVVRPGKEPASLTNRSKFHQLAAIQQSVFTGSSPIPNSDDSPPPPPLSERLSAHSPKISFRRSTAELQASLSTGAQQKPLSYSESKAAVKEFMKTIEPRDYELLTPLMGRTELLGRLPPEMRRDLLKICVYRVFPAGANIEMEEKVYVILKGSVTISLLRKGEGGNTLLRMKTKYEGEHFFIGSAMFEVGTESFVRPGCFKEFKVRSPRLHNCVP